MDTITDVMLLDAAIDAINAAVADFQRVKAYRAGQQTAIVGVEHYTYSAMTNMPAQFLPEDVAKEHWVHRWAYMSHICVIGIDHRRKLPYYKLRGLIAEEYALADADFARMCTRIREAARSALLVTPHRLSMSCGEPGFYRDVGRPYPVTTHE
jgi:hypothetical protein